MACARPFPKGEFQDNNSQQNTTTQQPAYRQAGNWQQLATISNLPAGRQATKHPAQRPGAEKNI
jgi:hypothetical protein